MNPTTSSRMVTPHQDGCNTLHGWTILWKAWKLMVPLVQLLAGEAPLAFGPPMGFHGPHPGETGSPTARCT